MSSFLADGAMEAICFFEPWNGSVFRYGPAAERLSSLPVLRHVTYGFDASNAAGRFSTPVPRAKKIDDAGGRSTSDVVRRVGWEASLAIAPGRPSRAVTTRRAAGPPSGGVWDYPPCARRARPRIRKSINNRHKLAVPSHARQRLNSSTRQSWTPICVGSDFCQSGCAAGSTMNAT